MFTWSNRHETENYTKERLDRALATMYWSQFTIGLELIPWSLDAQTTNLLLLFAIVENKVNYQGKEFSDTKLVGAWKRSVKRRCPSYGIGAITLLTL